MNHKSVMKAPHQWTVGGRSEKDLSQQNKVISVFYILFSLRRFDSIGENSTQKSVGRYRAISMGFSSYPGSLELLFKQRYVQISIPNFLTHYFISCFQSYMQPGQDNSLTFNRSCRGQETL